MLPTKINNVDVEYVFVTKEMHFSGENLRGEKKDDFIQVQGWNGDMSLLFFDFDVDGKPLSERRKRLGESSVPPKEEWILDQILSFRSEFIKENPSCYPFKIYVFRSEKQKNSIAITASTGDLRVVKFIPRQRQGLFD